MTQHIWELKTLYVALNMWKGTGMHAADTTPKRQIFGWLQQTRNKCRNFEGRGALPNYFVGKHSRNTF
jgi:hypothetical protein